MKLQNRISQFLQSEQDQKMQIRERDLTIQNLRVNETVFCFLLQIFDP